MDRRAYLGQLGVIATAAVAGCTDGGSPDHTSTETTGTTPTESAGTTPTDERATEAPSTETARTTPSPTGTTGTTPTDDVTATPASGCGGGDRLVNPSFECGTRAWTEGRDLPTDPNTGDPVSTNVAVTGFGREEPPNAPAAADGSHALELSIDGRQDDGTLWVQQTADLTGCRTLAVDVYSQQESFNVITRVAAYTGPDTTLSEADFDTSETPEDHAGWKTYEYPVDHAGEGLVAVGISVVWETEAVRYLDDVRLTESAPTTVA